MSPTTTFPGSSLGSFGQPPDHFCASTSPQKNGDQRQAGTHWLTARMKHLGGESHPWREENGIHMPDVLPYLGPRGLRFPCPDRNHRTGQYRSIAATYLARKGKNNRGRARLASPACCSHSAYGWPGRPGKHPELPAEGGFWVTQNWSNIFPVPSFPISLRIAL